MEKSTVMVLNVNVDNCDIQTLLSHFWDIEPLGVKCPEQETKREEEVIQPFKRHLKFEEKRYSLRLPWKDSVELVKPKGRLLKSGLSYNEIHSIVLPKWTAGTKLLVRHIHQLTLHGGISVRLSQLRTKYWIIQGRQLVKKMDV
ncbi:hypothetical protein HPB49_003477 [Dermacentor silvarum]|uniref:Uncharacterized protein n=1 Tax=Dermacentor silvarum TaxID=543639 RepID=A0ACB8DMF4_DERSI|nr:hypothetical protein HPB49_003477 [Dermacentor silvarum]